ncbi:SagB/ThcOx family dehydrogenase [Lysinibacillus sp. Ag94]|uniref:SagB/ThcOx family dehydrogenase n=1 Tax=Lysinibacillus sp. Ag94 TaxID=2936682 RepID=UPI00200C1C6F|nr:SagB/ThcOx family dehydrogenase [Lysinibacillus sp. Ag94]UPW83542.1 SagB/ThcOx family dehydrogenase [Lysinibacillus sp. Ag94]
MEVNGPLYMLEASLKIIHLTNTLILENDFYRIELEEFPSEQVSYLLELKDRPKEIEQIKNRISNEVVQTFITHNLLLKLGNSNFSAYFHRRTSMGINHFPWIINKKEQKILVNYKKYNLIKYPTFISERKSYRDFSNNGCLLRENELIKILAYAYGFIRDGKSRTVASAGGCYPLEIFIGLQNMTGFEKGIYSINFHDLDLQYISNVRDFKEFFVGEDINYDNVSCFVFICYNPQLNQQKYGDRGYRFALIEAGMIAQNIAYCVNDLDIEMINLGSYIESKIEDNLLNFNKEKKWIIHCIAVGGRSNVL